MSRFANAVTPSPQKRAGRRRLLSAVILLFLLSALCPDARADQNSEVDSVLLDAMKKTYEFDKAERTEERLLRGGRASRPGGPNAEELYAKGRACIVLEEYERAKDFFSRAADMGHADALFEYGSMLYFGDGGAQSREGGIALVEKAAERGSVKAQNVLGMLYEAGEGVEKNFGKAFHWTEKAADSGNMDAMRRMARYHLSGIGTEANIFLSTIFVVRLAENNDRESVELLNKFYASNEKGAKDIDCLIGLLYCEGDKIIKKDVYKAVKWLERAIMLGSMHAQRKLGFMYAFGIDVKQNKAEGMELLYAASRQGSFDAMKELGWIYFHIPRDRTKELDKLRELVVKYGYDMNDFEFSISRPAL